MLDSIYPSSSPNERSVGKTYQKPRPQKEKIKLRIHPCSIPTKFHTIHYEDNEEKGFNSTNKRFNISMNDLPGPGYYEKDCHYMHRKIPNFVSKEIRFKNITANAWEAKRSPAYYNPKEPTYSTNNRLSPAFRMPISSIEKFGTGNHGLVRDRWGSKPAPGPGSYDLSPSKNQMKSQSSVFKSRTLRGLIKKDELPPPGSYEPFVPSKKVSGALAAFKGTGRSVQIESNLTPGPGTYERDPIRQIPTKREKVKIGSIAPHLDSMQRSSSLSMIPRDDVPGPGNYEVAKASEKIHRGIPIASLGYLPRFANAQIQMAPGPGDYQISSESKPQSFHLNLKSLWI